MREMQRLGATLVETVNRHWAARGVRVTTCMMVDATMIRAPSSTQKAARARDPERHQTAKATPWYLGMKAHVGVDRQSKLIHP